MPPRSARQVARPRPAAGPALPAASAEPAEGVGDEAKGQAAGNGLGALADAAAGEEPSTPRRYFYEAPVTPGGGAPGHGVRVLGRGGNGT